MIPAKLKLESGKQLELNIPTSWMDVTFEQFYRINKIGKQPDMFEVYSVLLNQPVDVVKKIGINSFEKVVNLCNFVSDASILTIAEPDFKSIELNGIVYKFNPDMGNESIFRYQDWLTELKELDESDPFKLVPVTLAYFLRPEGEEYNYANIEPRTKLFMSVPSVQAIALYNFFFQKQKDLTTSIHLSQWSKTLMKLLREWSRCIGMVFTLPFTALPMATYYILGLLVKKAFMKFIRFFSTNKT